MAQSGHECRPLTACAAGTSKALKGLEVAQEAANATLGSLQAALALLQESAEAVVTVERARGLPDDPVSRTCHWYL